MQYTQLTQIMLAGRLLMQRHLSPINSTFLHPQTCYKKCKIYLMYVKGKVDVALFHGKYIDKEKMS